MSKLTICLISDLHCVGPVFDSKKYLIHNFQRLAATEKDWVFILAGDLCDNGRGKASFLSCFPCLCMNTCDKNADDEVDYFIQNVHKPLITVNKNVYMIHGNHDESTDWFSYPMVDYIKKFHNTTSKGCYFKEIECSDKQNILFVFLGKYPDIDALEFFEAVHQQNKSKLPYIIVQHYNFTGPYSDFWTESEKETYFRYLDDKNVLCVLFGHIHMTFADFITTIPSQKKIPVICGAGTDSIAQIKIGVNNEVYFYRI